MSARAIARMRGTPPAHVMRDGTQQDQILWWMENQGVISPADAVSQLGIYRLADVVWKLRRKGHEIITIDRASENRWGKKIIWAEYALPSKQMGFQGMEGRDGMP